MTLEEFETHVLSAIELLLQSVAANAPSSYVAAPIDFQEMKERLRTAAEEMILCLDLESAMSALTEHRELSLNVVALTKHLDDRSIYAAIAEAHRQTESGTSLLPGVPFGMFLLALSDGLEQNSPP